MAGIDPTLTGRMITALPLERMVSAPLMGAVKAQVQATKSYIDFLLSTCFDKDGKAKQVQFEHEELTTDSEGNLKQTQDRIIRVPLLSIIEHPNFVVKKVTIDFEMEVSQSLEEHSETSAEGGFSASMGWGPFKVSVHGKVSHKSEQTRKTDTRSKYTFHVEAEHAGPTEALERIIEVITKTDPVNKAAPVDQTDTSGLKSDVTAPDDGKKNPTPP